MTVKENKNRFHVKTLKGLSHDEIKNLQETGEVSGWEHGLWTEEYFGRPNECRTHEEEYGESLSKIDATKRIYNFLEKAHPETVNLNSDSKVIELGCNVGRNLKEAQKRYGCEVYGVDINQYVIDKCNSEFGTDDNFKKLNLDDGKALSIYNDNEFDLSITCGFLMHIPASKDQSGKHHLVSEILRISKHAWFYEFYKPEHVWYDYKKGGCTTGEDLINYDARLRTTGDIPYPVGGCYHGFKFYTFSKDLTDQKN